MPAVRAWSAVLWEQFSISPEDTYTTIYFLYRATEKAYTKKLLLSWYLIKWVPLRRHWKNVSLAWNAALIIKKLCLNESTDLSELWFLAQLAAWDKSSLDICDPVKAAVTVISLLMKRPGVMFDLENAFTALVLKFHVHCVSVCVDGSVRNWTRQWVPFLVFTCALIVCAYLNRCTNNKFHVKRGMNKAVCNYCLTSPIILVFP